MGNLSDGVYEFAFAYYDYRKIPDKLLDWLLKTSKEVYRKEYAVLFKFEHAKAGYEWKRLLDFVNKIEIGDDYKYIVVQGMEIEEVGSLDTFDLHARVAIFHTDESDITEPNITKANMKLDHDHFDMRYKNRGI